MRRAGDGLWRLPAVALLILTPLLIASGCNRQRGEQEGGLDTTVDSPVEVTGVQLGRAVGSDNRITDETSTFRPSDTIYASVRTEGVTPSATLSARWTFEDGQLVDESSRTIAPDGPEVTEFHVSKPDGWPVGTYEVAILLDGREVDRKSFRVESGG